MSCFNFSLNFAEEFTEDIVIAITSITPHHNFIKKVKDTRWK